MPAAPLAVSRSAPPRHASRMPQFSPFVIPDLDPGSTFSSRDFAPSREKSFSYTHLFGSSCPTHIMRNRFMARKIAKEMTVEEFDDWCNATKKFEAVAEAADEVGGPRLSLVPLPEQNDRLADRFALRLNSVGVGREPPPCLRVEHPSTSHPVRRHPPRILPQAARRLERGAPEAVPDRACRDRPGSPRRRRRTAFRPLGAGAARALAGLQRGLADGRAARRRQARADRLRSRDQRPRSSRSIRPASWSPSGAYRATNC